MAVSRLEAPAVNGNVNDQAKLGQIHGRHETDPNEQQKRGADDERHNQEEGADEYDEIENRGGQTGNGHVIVDGLEAEFRLVVGLSSLERRLLLDVDQRRFGALARGWGQRWERREWWG